jgi:hypothetical protein
MQFLADWGARLTRLASLLKDPLREEGIGGPVVSNAPKARRQRTIDRDGGQVPRLWEEPEDRIRPRRQVGPNLLERGLHETVSPLKKTQARCRPPFGVANVNP